jgi:hypothetical protein
MRCATIALVLSDDLVTLETGVRRYAYLGQAHSEIGAAEYPSSPRLFRECIQLTAVSGLTSKLPASRGDNNNYMFGYRVAEEFIMNKNRAAAKSGTWNPQ